jgi:hypothetical protein
MNHAIARVNLDLRPGEDRRPAEGLVILGSSVLLSRSTPYPGIGIELVNVGVREGRAAPGDAHATHAGRTISHYACDITREDGKIVASVTSTVMTLTGEKAAGR